MPIIDKPLAELQLYQGRNPRPADFDDYWAAALKELDSTSPDPEWRPSQAIAPRNAACFDLWFTGVGGARLYAKYIRPRSRGKFPAILQFHGYSGNSGDWADKLGWAAEGYCLAALDSRGQGGRSTDTSGVVGTTFGGHIIRGLEDPDPRHLLFRQHFLDTVQLARVVMQLPDVDPERIGCWGGSQGGGLALACAALEPRIRLVASAFPFLCDYRRVWEMDLAKDAYDELKYFFRSFDPNHEREEAIFTRLGYIDCQHLAPRIQADLHMFTALMDTICPPSTQFAAYNKVVSEKAMTLYPDFGHENLPGQIDRLFNFMQRLNH